MANQVIVTNTGNVQVALTPPPNVQVQISRAAIGTVSNVPTANFANYAANVTASNQPNITTVGTLGNLSVANTITTLNLNVTGNFSVGNLVANSANYANFANVSNTANSVAGGNVVGAVGLATFATTANAVAGANVSGIVANANYSAFAGQANTANLATFANTANSVAVGNVSGIGNIATVNLDGNAGNILYGNGTFAAVPNVANVANANYANFAGTAFSVSGSNVSGEVANANYASYANIANTANLATFASTANSVAGANVSGTVANANYSAFANIASTANSVAVANVVGIGNIATTNYDGNASNVLYGNGGFYGLPIISNVANANYANFSGTAFSVSGSNVSGAVANATYADNAGNANLANLATFATTANAVAGANVSGVVANANYSAFANIASVANSVAGANVSGEVANANFASYANIASTANSVAVANVVGIGNIATTNYDGNSSNILYGNGGFYGLPIISNVANANYANFAGEAFNVNASNITGTVANANYSAYAGEANIANLATFATTANAVAGANVSGVVANANYSAFANIAASANSVALANVSGIGNIANINLDGSSSNVLFGNGVFAPESTSIANANYANFAGTAFSVSGSNVSGEVANANYASFANLASTANLATFATTANAVAGANVSGEVANANYASFANVASTANSVAGANVSGEVANANYASFANIAASANSVALANVVGIGNIANINLDGSSSNVLFGNGVFAPESTSIANANYANFAGTVITNAQPNITSVGNLTSLLVTGNATFANALIFSGNNSPDIVGLDNSSNATARSIRITGANTTSPNVASNTFGGVLNFTGGNANADIDPGSRWDGRGGNAVFGGGNGSTANGNGIGGNLVLFSGSGFSNLNPATGGPVTITAGQATGANGNSTGGSITILTGRANSTTTGTSTSGNINFQIGTANGVTGNVIGSINIGSQAANANIASPTSINIGQANTPTNIGGNANIAGNLNVVGNITGNFNVATANFANFAGNVTVSSQPNITSVSNTFSSGQLTLNTTSNGAPSIQMFGVAGSSNSSFVLNQGFIQVTNTDLLAGQSPFNFNIYGNSAYQEPMNYFRGRGVPGTPANCVAGDTVLDQRWQVYANSSIQGIFRVGAQYDGFTSGLGAYGRYGFFTGGDTANCIIDFQAGTINMQGNVIVSGNASIYANGYINTNNEIDYLRTFGSFTSNATQTNGNVGNAVYMTLNNDEGSNGVSIVSSSQITVARTGRYNLQFSAQIEKTDSGTDQVEIWLTKNGNPVANSATQLELAGNGAKAVAAWNWVDQVTSANTYYQIAWGSTDANIQLTAIPSANTLSGVAVPSLIVTVVPVGA